MGPCKISRFYCIFAVADPAAGWGVGGGGKKHEIYAAAFGDLFLQGPGGGGMAPWIRYCFELINTLKSVRNHFPREKKMFHCTSKFKVKAGK